MKKIIMTKIFIKAIFISAILFYIYSCSDSVSNTNDIVFPDSNVSFQNHVQPFLKLACGSYYCHSTENIAGGIRLTEYLFILNDNPAIVIAGHPENSRLVMVMKGIEPHLQPITVEIKPNHIKGIETWIKEGALNN
jgi:hypothetical protein